MKRLYEVEVSRHFNEIYFVYADYESAAIDCAYELAANEYSEDFEIEAYDVNTLEEFCDRTGIYGVDIYDANSGVQIDLDAEAIFKLIEEQEQLEREKEYAKIHQTNLF